MQGFAVKPWTPAGYLKTVVIPADWKGARILLRSDGAQSLATFWVNGEARRERTRAASPPSSSTSRISAARARPIPSPRPSRTSRRPTSWPAGPSTPPTSSAGLTRKIALLAVPAVHIADVDVVTDVAEDGRTAAFRIEASVANAATVRPCGHRARPRPQRSGRPDRPSARRFRPGASDRAQRRGSSSEGTVDGAALWDAEHPRLHTLDARPAARAAAGSRASSGGSASGRSRSPGRASSSTAGRSSSAASTGTRSIPSAAAA